MNIDKIKSFLRKNIGKELHFKYNSGRNQIEEFNGYICNLYNYIFTVKPLENSTSLKSFSYKDILTNYLIIIMK